MTRFNSKMSALAGLAASAAVAAAIATPGEARAQGLTSPFQTPPGSWNRSCMGGMVMSGELIANCPDSRGFFRQSRIRVDTCRGAEIHNDNGNLICYPVVDRPRDRGDRGGRRGGAWGGRGGWITVYEHTNFTGRSQTFEQAVGNLVPMRWNDIISSVELRGVWEVCEHVDFQGRCEVIDADEPNLVPRRWNDIISSLRPLR